MEVKRAYNSSDLKKIREDSGKSYTEIKKFIKEICDNDANLALEMSKARCYDAISYIYYLKSEIQSLEENYSFLESRNSQNEDIIKQLDKDGTAVVYQSAFASS